ncbi:AI-2E family transporter [Clostridium frigidicarnis]|nr:AI-2E family transporter [Clostridium frigidicarnis]
MKYMKNPRFKANLLIATYVIVLAYVFLNLNTVFKAFGTMISIIKPFLIAIAIAFVLNIPMKLLEEKVLKFMDKSQNRFVRGIKRPISLTITLVAVIGLIIGLFIFVIPQLSDSVSTLVRNVPEYAKSLEAMMTQTVSNDMINDLINQALNMWKEVLQVLGQVSGAVVSQVLDITIGFASGVVNFFIGLILAIYMLLSKEKLTLQTKKVIYAFINKGKAEKIMEIAKISNIKFSKFVGGQCLEAVILGTLCFIGMTILSMPYTLLVSTVVGVTALIPIFGALIGTIPTSFIILMVDPVKAVWFIILIIVIQQLEGHFIYPLVVGSSIGLSALWVMFSMIVGGSLFGVLGMLIGIPLFGVIYTVFGTITNKRLQEKNLLQDNDTNDDI